MRVIGHGTANDGGHFLVASVVIFEKGMQNAALDRLEPVLVIRNGTVEDNIASVVEEPTVVESFKMVDVG